MITQMSDRRFRGILSLFSLCAIPVDFLTYNVCALLWETIPLPLFLLPPLAYFGIYWYFLREYGQNCVWEFSLMRLVLPTIGLFYEKTIYAGWLHSPLSVFTFTFTAVSLWAFISLLNVLLLILWAVVLTYRHEREAKQRKTAALVRIGTIPASGVLHDELRRLSADILVLHANAPETRRRLERCVANAHMCRNRYAGSLRLPEALRYGRIEIHMGGERIAVNDVFLPVSAAEKAPFLRFTEDDFADFVRVTLPECSSDPKSAERSDV